MATIKASSLRVKLTWSKTTYFESGDYGRQDRAELSDGRSYLAVELPGGGAQLHLFDADGARVRIWNYSDLHYAKKAAQLHAQQQVFDARNTRLANEAAGLPPPDRK